MNIHKSPFHNNKWKNILINGAHLFGIELTDEQLSLFAAHADHLCLWNRKINLTSISDPDDIALKHFVDSIAVIKYIPDRSRVLDIGSGGGFPGFCLKVLNPTLDIVMIDSARKKANFLKDLIRTTGTNGIEAKHSRAEELSENIVYAKSFDIIVSRAFASLEKFFFLAKPFLNHHGVILAMKSGDVSEEIDKLELNNDFTMDITKYLYDLPLTKIKRSIVKIS